MIISANRIMQNSKSQDTSQLNVQNERRASSISAASNSKRLMAKHQSKVRNDSVDKTSDFLALETWDSTEQLPDFTMENLKTENEDTEIENEIEDGERGITIPLLPPIPPVRSHTRTLSLASAATSRVMDNQNTAQDEQIPYDEHSIDENRTPLWKQMAPHVGLAVLVVVYVWFGTWLFAQYERPHWQKHKIELAERLQAAKDSLLDNIQRIEMNGGTEEEGLLEMDRYIAKAHEIHQEGLFKKDYLLKENPLEHITDDDWTFTRSVFFVVSMLTTVGYGDISPQSDNGKVIAMLYSLIGIPIVLFATADVAKFMSDGLTWLYVQYLMLKPSCMAGLYWLMTCCGRCGKRKPVMLTLLNEPMSPTDTKGTEDSDVDSMVEYLYEQLEHVHEVHIPSIIIFVLLFCYMALGGWLLHSTEDWTFSNAMYFSFISCMKVGFGDFIPIKYPWIALAYYFVGLVLTTVGIDVVGVQYLERIHQFGRRMTTADYLKLMKEAKLRKEREKVMRKHHNTLLMLMRVNSKAPDPARQLTRSTASNQLSAPRCPSNVCVSDLTPYSIKLSWSPSDFDDSTTFMIRWRLKHTKIEQLITIEDISLGSYEIAGLRSFSMYEISMWSSNQVGRSESIRFVQITEPESAPQNVEAKMVNLSSVCITWNPPCKKAVDVVKYTIYYTIDPDNPANTNFENWQKLKVPATDNHKEIVDLKTGHKYAFCISSVFAKLGHSPISKAVCVTLGLPDLPEETVIDEHQSVDQGDNQSMISLRSETHSAALMTFNPPSEELFSDLSSIMMEARSLEVESFGGVLTGKKRKVDLVPPEERRASSKF